MAFSLNGLVAQSTTSEARSPKAVVEQFLKLETKGGRVTPDGWRNAIVFFTRPSPPKQILPVFVIKKDFSVWDPIVKGTSITTEINVEIQPEGNIDSSLRFKPITRRAFKSSIIYKLVLTDKHWVPGAQGQPPMEVTGLPEWRIDDAGMGLLLDVDAAIRYVAAMRDKTTDSTITKNAAQTLAKLKKLAAQTT